MGSSKEEPEGFEPTEEVGPEGCDPNASRCENDEPETDTPSGETVPKFSEELQDSFRPKTAVVVMSTTDGLPIPADESAEPPIAPAFTIDHVVCVEDDREYVEVFREEQTSGITRALAVLIPVWSKALKPSRGATHRWRYDNEGKEVARRSFDPSRVLERWGVMFVELKKDELVGDEAEGMLVAVRPLRPRCKYYMRQIILQDGNADPDEFGTKKLFRNCMIRRSVGGAFMSVSDEAILACDYRDPPEPNSVEKYLDKPDRAHLRSDAHTKKLPIFGRSE